MTNNIMFFAISGFGEASGHNLHAMPIGLSGESSCFSSLVPPLFIMANGITVPISRGRPPGLSVQA